MGGKEIQISEETLESEHYLPFARNWFTLKILQSIPWKRWTFGERVFTRKTKAASKKKSLTEIVFEYAFGRGLVSARFHLDIGMGTGVVLGYDAIVFVTRSFNREDEIASYAGKFDKDQLGYLSVRRSHFQALVRSHCEELSKLYNVPVNIKFYKDPPSQYLKSG